MMLKLPAPRQGMFALILLTSFVLLSCTSLWTLSNRQHQHTTEQSTQVINQLGSELTMALLAKDSLSLSNIAKRYTHIPEVAGIQVFDGKDTLMARTGKDSEKITYEKLILNAEKPIGKVVLYMQHKPLGRLITDFWPIFLGLLVTHLLLWLAYVLTANQYVYSTATSKLGVGNPAAAKSARTGPLSDLPAATTTADLGTTKDDELSEQSSTTGLSAAQRLRQQVSGAPLPSNLQTPSQNNVSPLTSSAELNASNTPIKQGQGMTAFLQALSAYDNPVILQIQFDDPKHLITKLSPSVAAPFYNLCNQLLDQATAAISNVDLIQNIGFQRSDFAQDGVHIVVQSIDGQVDIAAHVYAAMLLAKLYTLLHDVTYKRYREIGRFALPVKACISNKANQRAMAGSLEYKAKADDIMICADSGELEHIKGKIQLASFASPTSITERQTATVNGVDGNLLNQLTKLRDQILSA